MKSFTCDRCGGSMTRTYQHAKCVSCGHEHPHPESDSPAYGEQSHVTGLVTRYGFDGVITKTPLN